MLKRQDLVKDFELVVKQEIKNHADVVYQTNQSINEFREKLSLAVDTEKKDIAKIHSQVSILQSGFLNIGLSIDKISHNVSSRMRDLEVLLLDHVDKIKESVKELEKSTVPRSIYLSDIKDLQEKYLTLQHSFATFEDRMRHKINDSHFRFNDTFDKHKKEIAIKPKELSELRNALNDRINSSRVDIEGIKKEIEVEKKKNFVHKKEIERLNIQIDRLKASKSKG